MLAACILATSTSSLKATPVPDEDRRCREVPHRADHDAGERGKPPLIVMMEYVGGNADIAHESNRANRIEGDQAPKKTPASLAGVAVGEDVVEDVVGCHGHGRGRELRDGKPGQPGEIDRREGRVMDE